MRLNPKQIALYTGGRFIIEPIDAAELLTGITWDSRDVKKGDLYVALPGENVDGHKFVEAALKAGARGALVTDTPDKAACVLAAELGIAVIEVPNTFHAIEDLARKWRNHITGKVVAITGSVGKTTTKNLVRDVCASEFKTTATLANQNNELGVPNTILSADPDTEVVVVEMGMRGLGQIKELCDIAKPDWGVITNIGETHMELLGSMDNIARAKCELFDALPNGIGWAFANASDKYTPKVVKDAKLVARSVRVAYYGHGADVADTDMAGEEETGLLMYTPRVWPEDVSIDAEGCAQFTLCARSFGPEGVVDPNAVQASLFDMEPDVRRASCHLSVSGMHNVDNACAACGVGLALGIDIQTVADALSNSLSETGRLETLRARDGFRVINDAYNANPDSMKAALSMMSSMDVAGRRIAVLGDMGELGDIEVSCHEGVGRAAAQSSLDKLICVGELSKHIAQGAIGEGMAQDCVHEVSTIGEALELLEGNVEADDVVLVKASHFMRLDRVVEGLVS